MARLDTFKERIAGGVRPNQFAVQLTKGFGSAVDNSGFSFLCHATSIPGSTIGQAQVFHRGRMIPLAGERSFNPWTVTVYADQEMNIRSRFEDWSNAMNTYADNTGTTTPDDYKAEGIIQLMERNNTVVRSYRVVGIFPIDISEIQLSWQQNDVVGEFSVTFAVESFDPYDKTLDAVI